jgi:putative PIN family toxin of toxin-antitoxin system
MIPRVVLDTNVVVSALLKPDSLEDQVLRLGLAGRLQLCLSAEIVAEYALVLPRAKFKLQPEEVRQALARLRGASTMFSPVRTIGVSKDDPDNRFLECAEVAGAKYLVTGNIKHFPKQYRGTQVVSARRLMELLIPSAEPNS